MAAVPALADQPLIRVNVPFAFNVGDVRLPAGEYQLARYSARSGAVMVLGNGKQSVYLLTFLSGQPAGEGEKFVFQRYGERYFLKTVHIAGATPLELPQSSTEKEYLSRAGQPEKVAVAGY